MKVQNSYKKILIVDDDPSLRTVLAVALEGEGYAVFVAENGRQGLDLLASMHPSVILTDLNMPVMNGWEFITAKQRDPALRSIPVIAISAANDTFTMEGVTCFIQKLFSLDALFAALDICCTL